MTIRTIASSGEGSAGHVANVTLRGDSRIDVDMYSNGGLTLWFGRPVAGSISTDRAGLERLYAVIGQALTEIGQCAATTNADSSTASNATVSPAVASTAPNA